MCFPSNTRGRVEDSFYQETASSGSLQTLAKNLKEPSMIPTPKTEMSCYYFDCFVQLTLTQGSFLLTFSFLKFTGFQARFEVIDTFPPAYLLAFEGDYGLNPAYFWPSCLSLLKFHFAALQCSTCSSHFNSQIVVRNTGVQLFSRIKPNEMLDWSEKATLFKQNILQ